MAYSKIRHIAQLEAQIARLQGINRSPAQDEELRAVQAELAELKSATLVHHGRN